METVICKQCEQPFEVKPYRVESARFCSTRCYGLWQRVHRRGVGRNRVTVSCYTCGKAMERQPCQVMEHNFCSRECFGEWRSSKAWSGENNPAWIGGHVGYRGPNWARQSAKARNRDGDTCQQCGVRDNNLNLPVHHIRPFHLFDDYREANRLTNLVTLCPICHTKADNAFWRDNPNLFESRRVPDVQMLKECERCGGVFHPRSPRTSVCDDCCTFTCANCGKKFYSRKISDRTPKYCSRDCRNKHVATHRIPRRSNSLTT
jgi:5-methylcytosine-specific restriction endonuclease McrA